MRVSVEAALVDQRHPPQGAAQVDADTVAPAATVESDLTGRFRGP
jgi:hypothetical protein